MDDMISRAAAIDALTDKNIEKNFDSAYDGELHRTKRAAIRIIANMPTVDAIPVEWIKAKMHEYESEKYNKPWQCYEYVLRIWQKEQEARLSSYRELVTCKNCKHFEIKDHWGEFGGMSILAASEVPTCNKWADGCKTAPDGFCFMAERRCDA